MKRVTTITGSVYYLDGKAVVRIPGGHSNPLRGDRELMVVSARSGLTIGQSMVLLLQKGNRTYTTRLTTPVVSVEELSSREIEDLLSPRGGGASAMELATTE